MKNDISLIFIASFIIIVVFIGIFNISQTSSPPISEGTHSNNALDNLYLSVAVYEVFLPPNHPRKLYNAKCDLNYNFYN